VIRFGFKVDLGHGIVFDSARLMRSSADATKKNLTKFGAFTRTRARSSIRRRKAVSAPGEPPSAHGDELKDIRFDYDERLRSVVIGPIRLPGKLGNAPEALEHSGPSVVYQHADHNRETRPAYIRERPFMGPAFAEELKRLPATWRDSMK